MGIDAYYDRFMFEDPWRDLLPLDKGTPDEEESASMTVESKDTVEDSSEAPSNSGSAIDELTTAENRTLHDTSPTCPNNEKVPAT